MQIKEKLKNYPVIVKLYEIIFGRAHSILERWKKIKRKLKVLTKTYACYGNKNKDKTFLVISCKEPLMGMYSATFYIMPFIDYAVKRNYIPVIDIQQIFQATSQPILQPASQPISQSDDRKGKINLWEYYYEQPLNQYTLEEVYQSRHVIHVNISEDYVLEVKRPVWNTMFPTSEKELKHWNQIIQSYIRLNQEFKDRVETEQKRIFKENRKVLGVGIRAELRAGAMREGKLYNNHPKQPTCEELMDIVEKKMQDWKCDALFISSDDREYLNKFISRFGDKCFYIERKLQHSFKNDMPVMKSAEVWSEFGVVTGRAQIIREQTDPYIVEVNLLAQCNCLYTCKGGGAMFAYFQNGGRYEHCEVYDKGLYSIAGSSNNEKDYLGFELK